MKSFKLWHLGTPVERGSSHQANDGGAIGVSNESTLPHPKLDTVHGFRVHLRNHQRNLLVHPKRRAVVHHDGSLIAGDGAELPADGAAGAEECNVDAGEALRRELLHDVLVPFEVEAAAGGALRRQHLDGAVGEVAVGEDGEELLADGAGDTHDGDGGSVFAERHSDLGGGSESGPGSGREGPGEEVVLAREGEGSHD